MQGLLLSLLLTFSFSLSLFASNTTTQEHLVSLSPTENAEAVKTKSLVEVTYDREIIHKSVKNKTITLKPINPKGKKVKATVSISDKSTLVLTPNELLKEGQYRVKINPIKLQANKDEYQLSSFMKKVFYWFCSWFYDDISECPLYKKFYKVPSSIKTKTIQYTFRVVDRPDILSIKLNITSLELNEGETAQLNAVASYDDNSTKDVTQEVVWSVDNPLVASIDTNATLNATQEGSTQITATLENVASQTLSLSVRKVINGHTLPPQPDETLNNSTLLGVDSNSNGVRDDVERHLLIKYKDHHKIVSEIALQSGRAFQIVLEHPENARETTQLMSAAQDCNHYFQHDADYYGDPILVDNAILEYKFKNLQLSTKDRIRAYLEYNHNLSGGVYRLTPSSQAKAKCDFNVTELLKAE